MINDLLNSSGSEHSCTPSERRSSRRYIVEFGIAIAAYSVLVFISAALIDNAHGSAKVVIALLPFPGFVGMMAVLVRFVLRTDELQRQMLLACAAIAALVTATVTMALGYLGEAGLSIPLTCVWPILALSFGIALPCMRRRYR